MDRKLSKEIPIQGSHSPLIDCNHYLSLFIMCKVQSVHAHELYISVVNK